MRNKKFKAILLVTGYCLLVTVFSGCAGSSSYVSGRGLRSTVTIGGARYVSLVFLAQRYSTQYAWDELTQKVVLARRDGKEFKVMAGSSTVLLNDSAHKMSRSAKVYQGALIIPQAFVRQKLDTFFKQQRRASTKLTDVTLRRVIIDAGHGGKDPGAVGRAGLREKDVTLDVAKRLRRKLEAQGIEVILSRDSDNFISLNQRRKIANSKDADFFISIHANAARSRRVSGIEVFYLSESVDDVARSEKAATNYKLNLRDKYTGKNTEKILWHLRLRENRRNSVNLAQCIADNLSRKLTQRNRGEKQARFYVLNAIIPSILVEVGFLSNVREERKLRDSAYKERIAQGISDGLAQYNQALIEMRTARF